MARDENTTRAVSALTEDQRRLAMERFATLRPHLEDDVPLTRAARHAGISVRTAERWLARYRVSGLAGLSRLARNDTDTHKLAADMIALIEGMGLKKPRSSAAAIHRNIGKIAVARGWRAPSYRTVHAILSSLDPALTTLAQDGAAAFRNRYELIHRHRAEAPNALWQADHTMLDILVVDANGKPVRPWLSVIMDDYSRAVAGYMVLLGAPSALHTSLALRQGIWRKQDPSWPVCGIPDVLYVDHGSDFTSLHLEQVAAALRIELIHSTVARPQGRGKIERFFGTINTELLSHLAGRLVRGHPPPTPTLSLAELDAALSSFIVNTYNKRPHSQTGETPHAAWCGQGWLPRMPDSLDDLDLLLLTVAKARTVRRDGIRFQGLRFIDPTLAAYVGEAVTIRYDPRDLSEIRVFHHDHFLCRAVSPEHAGRTVTLKDIETARTAYRRSLRTQIRERVARVTDFLPVAANPLPPRPVVTAKKSRLRTYLEGD
jgi:putative transposase